MNAAAWIAIVALIVTLSTSWLQFWLKERSEKKRTLATANPPTNQPKPEESSEVWRPTNMGTFGLYPLNFLASWGATGAALQLLFLIVFGTIPIRAGVIFAFVCSLLATLFSLILLFRAK